MSINLLRIKMIIIEASIRMTEIALTLGSIDLRIIDQMSIGRVLSAPITKNVMRNSSNESANTTIAAPIIEGAIIGNVTFQNV